LYVLVSCIDDSSQSGAHILNGYVLHPRIVVKRKYL
jgi:hypothetical protein